MGQANHGWCKLKQHPEKQALTWDDEVQVDALIRDAWGDVGHLTVFVRRDDAAPERRWSATVFDHENRALATVQGPTKKSVDVGAVERLRALGYTSSGYRSKADKPGRFEGAA